MYDAEDRPNLPSALLLLRLCLPQIRSLRHGCVKSSPAASRFEFRTSARSNIRGVERVAEVSASPSWAPASVERLHSKPRQLVLTAGQEGQPRPVPLDEEPV
jgi:hypothetical protein